MPKEAITTFSAPPYDSTIGGLPVPTSILSTAARLENLHVLYYRQGSDPRSQHLNFSFQGTFKEAIARGRNFCEKMGWRFVKVEQFLTNLEEREKRNSGQTDV